MIVALLLSAALAAPPTRMVSLAQGKDMGAGFCGAHGNYTGGSCPRCSGGATPAYTGPSLAELERMRKEREEALAKAKADAEKARVRKEIAELDAAIKTASEAAKRVRADLEASRRAEEERRKGEQFADGVLRGLLEDLQKDAGKTPDDQSLFSKGTKNSAPADIYKQGSGTLTGQPEGKGLDFIGIPGSGGPPKPPRKVPLVVADPRTCEPTHEELQDYFTVDFRKRRWPGPANPGEKLVNPLIEEARKQEEELGMRYLQDVETEALLARDLPEATMRKLLEGKHEELRKGVLRDGAVKVREEKVRLLLRLRGELDGLEKSGALAKGENPFEKEKSDPELRTKLDAVRAGLLGTLGKNLTELNRQITDTMVKGMSLTEPRIEKPVDLEFQKPR